mgnify:CR=1 FL=1
MSLLIRGATMIDGLGHEPKRADVLVKDGKIVDGFMGAQPESVIRETLDRHVGGGSAAEREAALARAAKGDYLNALGTLRELVRHGQQVVVETNAGKQLYQHYAAGARELGNEVPAEFTGGCADSGFSRAQW